MTTKEQERKALEQIKKIIASLGEDSYVATAFEGCFEIAEENIENDFGCSMKDRAESAEKRAEDLYHQTQTLQYQLDQKAEAVENLKHIIEVRDRIISDKTARIEELNEQLEQGADIICNHIDKEYDQEQTIEAQKTEIITLKAKLYDLMMAERSA